MKTKAMQNKKLTYLYLDDNDKTMRDGDVRLLNNSPNISIITDYPNSWRKRSQQMLTEINDYDGLILDWEFTNKSEKAKQDCEQAEDVDYSAEAIAEHIRIQAAQKNIKEIPIILCSADKNNTFTKLRKREQTSQDLFDLALLKKQLFVTDVEIYGQRLFDLAKTYQSLQKASQNVHSLLSINKGDLENTDIRFIDLIQRYIDETTTHDLIQFMLREFIEKEGLLIDDVVLAARLGVDIENSKDYWSQMKKILTDAELQYKGVLSMGWERFWAFKLESWWKYFFGTDDLRILKAQERVEMLNNKFGINLKSADKIPFCKGTEFWTVCNGTKKPIDPIDGFIIGEYLKYPWQEPQYVSAFAELEKQDTSSWRINIMDRDRFKKIKSIITQKK
jgi:hypothetical protein